MPNFDKINKKYNYLIISTLQYIKIQLAIIWHGF